MLHSPILSFRGGRRPTWESVLFFCVPHRTQRGCGLPRRFAPRNDTGGGIPPGVGYAGQLTTCLHTDRPLPVEPVAAVLPLPFVPVPLVGAGSKPARCKISRQHRLPRVGAGFPRPVWDNCRASNNAPFPNPVIPRRPQADVGIRSLFLRCVTHPRGCGLPRRFAPRNDRNGVRWWAALSVTRLRLAPAPPKGEPNWAAQPHIRSLPLWGRCRA